MRQYSSSQVAEATGRRAVDRCRNGEFIKWRSDAICAAQRRISPISPPGGGAGWRSHRQQPVVDPQRVGGQRLDHGGASLAGHEPADRHGAATP